MVAPAKLNLGKMPCPCCQQPVAVKQSATGKLTYQCQEADCEATGYADKSSAAAKKWLASLPAAKPVPEPAKPAPAPAPAKPPAPAAAAAPAPPAPAPKTGFTLGGL